MTAVNLIALLPDTNGSGWFAIGADVGRSCSQCDTPAVAYHRQIHQGDEDLAVTRYRCAVHMAGLEVRNGRVWKVR